VGRLIPPQRVWTSSFQKAAGKKKVAKRSEKHRGQGGGTISRLLCRGLSKVFPSRSIRAWGEQKLKKSDVGAGATVWLKHLVNVLISQKCGKVCELRREGGVQKGTV